MMTPFTALQRYKAEGEFTHDGMRYREDVLDPNQVNAYAISGKCYCVPDCDMDTPISEQTTWAEIRTN